MIKKENPGALAGAAGAEGLVTEDLPSTPALTHPQAGEPLRIVISNLYVPTRVGPEWWRADLDTGELLVARTKQPMLDGARALLAQRHDPATPTTMRLRREGCDSFEPKPLGMITKWTTSEPADRSVHFRKWRPAPEIAGACVGGGEKPALEDARASCPAGSVAAAVAEGAT